MVRTVTLTGAATTDSANFKLAARGQHMAHPGIIVVCEWKRSDSARCSSCTLIVVGLRLEQLAEAERSDP